MNQWHQVPYTTPRHPLAREMLWVDTLSCGFLFLHLEVIKGGRLWGRHSHTLFTIYSSFLCPVTGRSFTYQHLKPKLQDEDSGCQEAWTSTYGNEYIWEWPLTEQRTISSQLHCLPTKPLSRRQLCLAQVSQWNPLWCINGDQWS